MLGIKHLHLCLDGKYFIFLTDHSLLKGSFHGKKAGWPVHPKKEIVCKVKADVDILPLPTTAEMESLQKERTSATPAQERGNLDTSHALCTVHTVLHSETKNWIKYIEYFCLKYFQSWWGPEKSISIVSCKELSSPVPPQHHWDAQHVGLISWDLKICAVGHTHPQNKDVHGDLSGLHC